MNEVISLFSGCGGFDLGLLRSGGKVVKAYELDKQACEAYERVTQNDIEQQDLAALDMMLLSDCDGIIGGPPCQDFSQAGRNAGSSATRNLWPVTLRAVKLNRPRWFLFENVPNLARRHKLYFRSLIEEFSSIGYRVDWRILNAANYGVPQTRERLFIAGMLDGSTWRWPTPTHFENAGWGFKRWISWYEALKDWVDDAPPHYLPQWILKKYENRGLFDSVPENAYFPGENMRIHRQHREVWEPATTVTNGTNHVRRVVVNGRVFKLDERGAASLQTLPANAGLKNVQIGNAVPPVMAEAIFRAAFAV